MRTSVTYLIASKPFKMLEPQPGQPVLLPHRGDFVSSRDLDGGAEYRRVHRVLHDFVGYSHGHLEGGPIHNVTIILEDYVLNAHD